MTTAMMTMNGNCVHATMRLHKLDDVSFNAILRKILDKDNERIFSVDWNHTATFENEQRFGGDKKIPNLKG